LKEGIVTAEETNSSIFDPLLVLRDVGLESAVYVPEEALKL
jgi:hypothetical protein